MLDPRIHQRRPTGASRPSSRAQQGGATRLVSSTRTLSTSGLPGLSGLGEGNLAPPAVSPLLGDCSASSRRRNSTREATGRVSEALKVVGKGIGSLPFGACLRCVTDLLKVLRRGARSRVWRGAPLRPCPRRPPPPRVPLVALALLSLLCGRRCDPRSGAALGRRSLSPTSFSPRRVHRKGRACSRVRVRGRSSSRVSLSGLAKSSPPRFDGRERPPSLPRPRPPRTKLAQDLSNLGLKIFRQMR